MNATRTSYALQSLPVPMCNTKDGLEITMLESSSPTQTSKDTFVRSYRHDSFPTQCEGDSQLCRPRSMAMSNEPEREDTKVLTKNVGSKNSVENHCTDNSDKAFLSTTSFGNRFLKSCLRKARPFELEIADDIRQGYRDLERFCKPRLCQIRGGGHAIEMDLQCYGVDKDTAKPCIVFSCDKKDKKRVRNFIRQENYKQQCQHLFGEPNTVPSIVEIGLKLLHDSGPRVFMKLGHSAQLDSYGSVLRFQVGENTHLSTLGGLIKIVTESGNLIYGLTSGHALRDDDLRSVEAQPGDSNEQEVHNDGADACDDHSLSSDTDSDSCSSTSGPPSDGDGESTIGFSASSHAVVVADSWHVNINVPNFDWALVRFDPLSGLHAGFGNASIIIDEIHDHADGPAGESVTSQHIQGRNVKIYAGVSGLQTGSISSYMSSLLLPGTDSVIHVHKIKLGDNKDSSLKYGDSGSWVVDADNGKLYGHIIAMDRWGVARVVPMSNTFEAIRLHLDCVSVTLPSSEDFTNDTARETSCMPLNPTTLIESAMADEAFHDARTDDFGYDMPGFHDEIFGDDFQFAGPSTQIWPHRSEVTGTDRTPLAASLEFDDVCLEARSDEVNTKAATDAREAAVMTRLGACAMCRRDRTKCDIGLPCVSCRSYSCEDPNAQVSSQCRPIVLKRFKDMFTSSMTLAGATRIPFVEGSHRDNKETMESGAVNVLICGRALQIPIKLIKAGQLTRASIDGKQSPIITLIDEHLRFLLQETRSQQFVAHDISREALREIYRYYEASPVGKQDILHIALKLLVIVDDSEIFVLPQSEGLIHSSHGPSVLKILDYKELVLIDAQVRKAINYLICLYVDDIVNGLLNKAYSDSDGDCAVILSTMSVICMILGATRYQGYGAHAQFGSTTFVYRQETKQRKRLNHVAEMLFHIYTSTRCYERFQESGISGQSSSDHKSGSADHSSLELLDGLAKVIDSNRSLFKSASRRWRVAISSTDLDGKQRMRSRQMCSDESLARLYLRPSADVSVVQAFFDDPSTLADLIESSEATNDANKLAEYADLLEPNAEISSPLISPFISPVKLSDNIVEASMLSDTSEKQTAKAPVSTPLTQDPGKSTRGSGKKQDSKGRPYRLGHLSSRGLNRS